MNNLIIPDKIIFTFVVVLSVSRVHFYYVLNNEN